ncbi:hypothetical protein HPP92_013358 [Vanilla planifolia]|uniref:RRM domain-containing protein n=1 Tax=Vanilla planifolia TaxID=51239 RepID=A0A835QZ91_VANPL|nr:hypothetical protein HPP92_013358 [Vanilla planifolia]
MGKSRAKLRNWKNNSHNPSKKKGKVVNLKPRKKREKKRRRNGGRPCLLSYIRSIADLDLAHRNIFVHGLGWDVTREALVEAFSPFGKVEECKIVLDKVTNRPKGYGFVLFSTRAAAVKALKEPQKKIGNRLACCQLASVGPVTSSSNSADIALRRIYVSNVHPDVSREKLKSFLC